MREEKVSAKVFPEKMDAFNEIPTYLLFSAHFSVKQMLTGTQAFRTWEEYSAREDILFVFLSNTNWNSTEKPKAGR